MQEKIIEQFWQRAKKAAEIVSDAGYQSCFAFGDDDILADELGQLVASGVKTATASGYESYAIQHEPLPATGGFDIVLGSQRPLAVISNELVSVVKFADVDAQQAYLEGEGDRSLAYWRQVHEAFFKEDFKADGLTFSYDSDIVLERFRLVYAEGHR
ncbi:ASCH domain-containing protein [Oenococcus sicerae]|uniref:ASCH domain-containing protein n=1 Tax=Oenococcus sicerae TaxID=2203724 RepID=A0AAJ1R9X6_9LACO|nr:ASCH domain-containing protein [Oenococcus sicerae]MDN6900452.1 ASCH domain-containing protein [Oenococcus sicerae]QAS69528.1 ASCH domain-containing protein [Oenococcus sicerae]